MQDERAANGAFILQRYVSSHRLVVSGLLPDMADVPFATGARWFPARQGPMLKSLKSSFVWQFAGGFVLGAVGLFALQPSDAPSAFPAPAPVAETR